MKYKIYLILALTGILLVLGGVGGLVYYIDPYQQYHTPREEFAYNMDTNSFAYYNPGIAKNYEYDTVITGSSMSRALLPSYVDEKFSCKTVKLSMAEARGKDLGDLFEVLERQENWGRVIMALDTFAYTVDKDYSSYEKPEYLYDDNPLNDMLYLVNMDGLTESVKTVSYTWNGGETTSRDDYQNYVLENEFSEEVVLEILRESGIVEKANDYDVDELRRTITDNLNQNIIPVIENNPEVEFIFYYPPYSIVRWAINPEMESVLKAMEIIAEELIEYPNVSLFFYQGKQDVMTDLNHYMDTIHFDTEVANDIVDFVAEDSNKMTIDNYKQTIDEFANFLRSYDYDILLE